MAEQRSQSTSASLPSVAQVVNRMNRGHFDALVRLSNGLPMFEEFRGSENLYVGVARLRRTISATLSRWGAVESGQLTPLGRAFLNGYSDRYGASS